MHQKRRNFTIQIRDPHIANLLSRTDIHDLISAQGVMEHEQINGTTKKSIQLPIIEISMKIDISIGVMSAKETPQIRKRQLWDGYTEINQIARCTVEKGHKIDNAVRKRT